MADEQYNLTLLQKDPNHVFELKTTADAIVPITMKGILGLTPVPDNQRAPNNNEAMCLLSTILGQGANPYAAECGLMPIYSGGFHYGVWVAAQVRMRKAQAQTDYDGYRWGWITKDGTRHETGRASKAKPDEIIGVWGEVYRKGQTQPYYHETYVSDFKKETKSGKGTWDIMPTVMILKVNRDQTHKFAYADCMGNLNTAEELNAYNEQPLPAPACDTPPRDERRKKVENVVAPKIDEELFNRAPAQEVAETGKQPDVPASNTESSTEAAEAGTCLNVEDVWANFTGLGGNKFEDWAAYVLCCEKDEVDKPEKFTADMLAQLNRHLEANGVDKSKF